ncbi:MAG: pyrroline-5-carboxylate reductase, partial [Nitrospirae bacterium RBG_16_43_8]
GIVQSSKFKVKSEIIVSEPGDDRRKYLEQTYGVKTTSSNKEVASSCNIIILAVKPQIIGQVLEEIKGSVTDDKTVISIAAGITLSYLQSKLNTKKIIRVMSNTPAIVHEGMSVISLCECFSDKDINLAESSLRPIREIFMSIGKVLTLPEKYMNAVTALSGSGPAFIAFFIVAMVEGGVKSGLSKENASELAIQTLLGTARLLETRMPPEKLREMVTSPGGTTAAGLKVFEEKKLRDTVLSAIDSAVKRAEELGRKE